MKKDDLKKLIKERDRTISRIEKNYKNLLTEKQRFIFDNLRNTFLDKLERDESGNVKHTDENFFKIGIIEASFDEMSRTSKKEMVSNLISNVDNIVGFNQKYFTKVSGKAEVAKSIPTVTAAVSSWLGIEGGSAKKNGFIDQLVDDKAAKIAIKNLAMKIVIGQSGYEDAKDQLKTLVEGNPDRLGLFEKHYKTFANDLYSQIDRATSNVLRNDLGLEFAVYEGGLIETSREFCEKHNGKVYHISEIKKFKPKKAIPPDYDPITDLGGYNCRHHLNWISKAMAKSMGKNVDKFTNTTEPTTVKKKTEDPISNKTFVDRIEKDISAINNKSKARDYIINNFGSNKATISSKLSLDDLKVKIQAVKNLLNEYQLTTNSIEKISFASSRSTYGYVKYGFNGKIQNANFGHLYADNGSRNYDYDNPEKNISKFKSSVDPENVKHATTVHEFAHLITTSRRKSLTIDDSEVKKFWKEVKEVRLEYANELNGYIRSGNKAEAGKIYMGKYAHTNMDEFVAESFAQYKLKKEPTKYANKIGKLMDKYFKK